MYTYIDINSGFDFLKYAMQYAENKDDLEQYIKNLNLENNIYNTKEGNIVSFCIKDNVVLYATTSDKKEDIQVIKDLIEQSNGDLTNILTKVNYEDTMKDDFFKKSNFIINGVMYKI